MRQPGWSFVPIIRSRHQVKSAEKRTDRMAESTSSLYQLVRRHRRAGGLRRRAKATMTHCFSISRVSWIFSLAWLEPAHTMSVSTLDFVLSKYVPANRALSNINASAMSLLRLARSPRIRHRRSELEACTRRNTKWILGRRISLPRSSQGCGEGACDYGLAAAAFARVFAVVATAKRYWFDQTRLPRVSLRPPDACTPCRHPALIP